MKRAVKPRYSNTLVTTVDDTLPRGRRMIKVVGGAASYVLPFAAILVVAITGQAMADDECGTDSVGANTIICNASNYAGGSTYPNFPAGITYVNSDGLTLTLNNAALIVGDTGVRVTSSITGVNDISINGINTGAITTSGADAYGLYSSISNTASTATSEALLAAGVINTTGFRAYGVYAETFGLGDALAQMDGGTVTTSGQSAHGLFSSVRNTTSTAISKAFLTDGAINATGDSAYGISALTSGLGDGLAQMDGGTITTRGDNAYGLYSSLGNASSTATSEALVTDGAINTNGFFAHGVYAQTFGGGKALARMDGGTVTTVGPAAYGLYSSISNTASTATSEALVTDGAINTNGFFAHGVYAQTFGGGKALARMDGGTVTTVGPAAYGLYSNATNTATSQALLADGAINTTGAGAYGVYAETFGLGNTLAQMDGGTVTTDGQATHGLLSSIRNITSTATSEALVTDGVVNTAGGSAYGVYAQTSGRGNALAQMDGGTVTTSGAGAYGLYSSISNTTSAASSNIVLTGSVVKTTGDAAHGVYAQTSGLGDVAVSTVGLGSIMTTGEDASGIQTLQNNTLATGTTTITVGSNIVAGGDGIHVSSVSSGAVLITGNGNITGGTGVGDDGVEVAVQNAVTVNVNGSITGDPGILVNSAFGPVVIGGAGDVTGLQGNGIETNLTNAAGVGDITIARDGVITGGSNGIQATNAGSGDILVTANRAVTGGNGYAINTATISGATSTITLNAGASISSTSGLGILNNGGESITTVNTGASVAGEIVLGSGSDNLTFSGGDFSGVTLFDGGDDIGTADGFVDVLTFSGSTGVLVGSNVRNWESIAINADSAISFSDNMLTMGTLTTNVGGILSAKNGELGITGNVTNNGAIDMQDGAVGDTVTISGDYAGTGNLWVDVDFGAGTADTLVVAGNVTGGATIINVADITTSRATSNDVLVVDVTGTTVADDFVLATTSSGAFDYDLELQGKRFLLTRAVNSTGAVYEAAPSVLRAFNSLPTLEQRLGGRAQHSNQALWIRLHGDNSDTALTNSSMDSRLWGVQVGADFDVNPGQNNRWVVGITGQYGDLSSRVTNPLGSGDIDTTGYGLGFTATWYDNKGTYVDGQAQVNWLDNDIASSSAGTLASSHSSRAYALSLEAGYRFVLGANSTIIPQTQVTWGNVEGGRFTDSVGNTIDLETNENTVARVGLAYEYSWGNMQKVYIIGDILHDFSTDTAVSVANTLLSTKANFSTWGKLGIGGSIHIGNILIYGETIFRTALLDGSRTSTDKGLNGTIGLSFKW